MNIIKASAGSGKTYRLSEDVVKLLLESTDPLAYRQILAVTFTNKATDEMKDRILKKLLEKSADFPKARKILIDILHDYSAFSVSTIDRFFQQALKAFARELSQSSNYQIELDRDALIEEAMDRILDGLSEDNKEVLGWVKGCVREMIEQGEKANFANRLHEIGKSLKSEDAHCDFSKERLDEMRSECRRIKKEFHSKTAESAALLKPCLSGKNALKQIEEYMDLKPVWDTVPYPKSSLAKEFGNSSFGDLFGEPYREYNTVVIIEKLFFTLGLAGEFYKEFDTLLKEKNVMCLDESNVLLKKIIDGSDAPFVYEKLGVRYKHFLLDEFQDTSRIQWVNFLPLLKESESAGDGMNLIVGDVKQSIYRWRNSDWRLLDSDVPASFPDKAPETLENNWRSCSAVVDFNNAFFKFAAEALGKSDIYADVGQTVRCTDSQRGQVRVDFCPEELDKLVESINDVRSRGAALGDIAILVRGHKDGTEVAARLLEEGIPVVSDDSLKVKSSETVRRVCFSLEEGEIPQCYHSLVDLCESKLREMETDLASETLYIQSFMDEVRTWSQTYGNNVAKFLEYWNSKNPSIVCPESPGAVRIMTIHKSKGLEFPHVIFPFAESVSLGGGSEKWCTLSTDGTSLPRVFDGSYPIDLSSSCEQSLFDKDWEEECDLQKTDALNLFYVALTRASKSLHVIASVPSKAFLDSLNKGCPEYKNMSQLLFRALGRSYEYSSGDGYDFVRGREETENRVEAAESDCPSVYVSIPLAGRLKPSTDASDFFGEDGSAGPDASQRLAGIALHGILSEVQLTSDLRAACDRAVLGGVLDTEQGRQAFDLLSARVAAHPEWFSSYGFNERAIIDGSGLENRPDRVIVDGNSAVIIDYKFGEPDSQTEAPPRYARQLSRYKRLYKELGYTQVRTFLWYVRADLVFEI